VDRVRVLFLSADPESGNPLRLDKEIRAITEALRAVQYRDAIELTSRWAVRPSDLMESLLEFQPHVVHFSGHGNCREIMLVDEELNAKPVSRDALVSLFRDLRDNIRLVLLNACYSTEQGEAIAEVVDCVIGMKSGIADEAAIVFSASFYRALGFGRSVQLAFNLGRTAMQLEGISGFDTPVLCVRSGVDPAKVILVEGDLPKIQGTGHGTASTAGRKAPGERGQDGRKVIVEVVLKGNAFSSAEEVKAALFRALEVFLGKLEIVSVQQQSYIVRLSLTKSQAQVLLGVIEKGLLNPFGVSSVQVVRGPSKEPNDTAEEPGDRNEAAIPQLRFVGRTAVVSFSKELVTADHVLVTEESVAVTAIWDVAEGRTTPAVEAILLDFTNVDFLSAAAVGKLISLHKRLSARGMSLVLCNVRPEIGEVFAITRLDRVFEFKDGISVDEFARGF